MSEPDRDQVAEALEDWVQEYVFLLQHAAPKVTLEPLENIVAAARAWLGLEGAVIIRRDARPTEHAVLAWIEEPYEAVDGTIMPLSVIRLIAAARGLVELVESGQEVWWCDAHQSSVSSDYLESGNPCWFMMFAYRGDKGEFGRAHLPCRMVRKLLADPPEEKP